MSNATKSVPAAKARDNDADFWNLRLYVAGQTPKCVAAVRNLNKFCEENLAGKYRIEVIDLLVHPQLARGDQIVPDPRARLPGRGAYLHLSQKCFEQAVRRRAFARALRQPGPLAVGALGEYLA